MESSEKLDLPSSEICSLWSPIVDRAICMQRKLDLLLLLSLLALLWTGGSAATTAALLLLAFLFLCRVRSHFYLRKEGRVFSNVYKLWRMQSLLTCSSASSFLH